MKTAKYIFSESAGLLCRIGNFGRYDVVNGGWTGIRDGDKFTITPKQPEDTPLTISDWTEVYPEEMSSEWQHEWYYKRDRNVFK